MLLYQELAVKDVQVPIQERQGDPLLQPVAFGDGKTSLGEMVGHFNVTQRLATFLYRTD